MGKQDIGRLMGQYLSHTGIKRIIMSTITIFNNEPACLGNHETNHDAVAIINCDDCFDELFLNCTGSDQVYKVINDLELGNSEYHFECEKVQREINN